MIQRNGEKRLQREQRGASEGDERNGEKAKSKGERRDNMQVKVMKVNAVR